MAIEISTGGVLLPQSTPEILDYVPGPFPVGFIDPVLRQAAESDTKSGIVWAARLLLRQVSIIHFVNTDTEVPYFNGEEDEPAYNVTGLLGFNDHGGGTESAYKILVNDLSLPQPEQYVLCSPPESNKRHPNLTFRPSDFAFLEWASGEHRYTTTPEPLKTLAAASQQRRDADYEQYLFGNSQTPAAFMDLMCRIGFSFADEPYSYEERCELTRAANEAKTQMGSNYTTWPSHSHFKQQFDFL